MTSERQATETVAADDSGRPPKANHEYRFIIKTPTNRRHNHNHDDNNNHIGQDNEFFESSSSSASSTSSSSSSDSSSGPNDIFGHRRRHQQNRHGHSSSISGRHAHKHSLFERNSIFDHKKRLAAKKKEKLFGDFMSKFNHHHLHHHHHPHPHDHEKPLFMDHDGANNIFKRNLVPFKSQARNVESPAVSVDTGGHSRHSLMGNLSRLLNVRQVGTYADIYDKIDGHEPLTTQRPVEKLEESVKRAIQQIV